MASRYNIPSDNNMKPGPGAHRPEKVCKLIKKTLGVIILLAIYLQLNLGHVPSYSFGIKHSNYLGHFREGATSA